MRSYLKGDLLSHFIDRRAQTHTDNCKSLLPGRHVRTKTVIASRENLSGEKNILDRIYYDSQDHLLPALREPNTASISRSKYAGHQGLNPVATRIPSSAERFSSPKAMGVCPVASCKRARIPVNPVNPVQPQPVNPACDGTGGQTGERVNPA